VRGVTVHNPDHRFRAPKEPHVIPCPRRHAVATTKRDNAFLIDGDDGFTLVDVGWASAPGGAFWEARTSGRPAAKTHWQPFEADAAVSDGDIIDGSGGLRVIHTPGHSPGHIVLLHEPSSTVLVGDAVFNRGKLALGPDTLAADPAAPASGGSPASPPTSQRSGSRMARRCRTRYRVLPRIPRAAAIAPEPMMMDHVLVGRARRPGARATWWARGLRVGGGGLPVRADRG